MAFRRLLIESDETSQLDASQATNEFSMYKEKEGYN